MSVVEQEAWRPGEEQTFRFETVVISVDCRFSEAEGASLLVDARLPDADGYPTRDLYQFIAEQPPTGLLFAGDHGFTGLSYIHPPGSAAAAQYFCKVPHN